MEPTQIVKTKEQLTAVLNKLIDTYIRPKQIELELTSEYPDID
jgi:hypothetical protein